MTVELPEWQQKIRRRRGGRPTGKELREWRESKGLKQAELAVILDVSPTTIHTAERRGEKDMIPAPLFKKLSTGQVAVLQMQVTCDLGEVMDG
jgi:DNA-binding XRE family transcriptional regulator